MGWIGCARFGDYRDEQISALQFPVLYRIFTERRPDLSIIAPARNAARMPGTGPLRRSSRPGRIQAIVGKSRFDAALRYT